MMEIEPISNARIGMLQQFNLRKGIRWYVHFTILLLMHLEVHIWALVRAYQETVGMAKNSAVYIFTTILVYDHGYLDQFLQHRSFWRMLQLSDRRKADDLRMNKLPMSTNYYKSYPDIR